jgi:signal transduction histidine kinase
MSRRRALGVRGRLAAALILTTAVALGVVAVALPAPLERRLRSDAVRDLTETALAARPMLAELPMHDARRGSRALQIAVDDLERRTGADVAAVDARGDVIAASERGHRARYPDAVHALAANRAVGAVASTPAGAKVRVAVPGGRRHHAYGLSLRQPLTTLESAGRVAVPSLIVAALVAVGLAFVADRLLGRRLAGRLNALRGTVLRMDAADPLGATADDAERDEVGDLARAFAAMQKRVAEHDQARRTFVATASHELRMPLASLHLMLGLLEEELRRDVPDLADARDQVARATAQSARITGLCRDLLELSRLDARVPLRDELVELGKVARDVVAEHDAAGERVAIDPEAPSVVWVRGEPGGVAQILRILLDNALRFAPAGTSVTVRRRSRNSHAEVAVCDDGPGIPEEDHDRIFEPFERGHGRQEGPGFGLGLAIGRDLARRMGGELRLSATPSPTCFILELPVASTGRAREEFMGPTKASAWPESGAR